ncbi:histidine phosphatase superfamily [Nemania sp. NC0429]|nr:histidine phosphatase superfamily [Nemania sp. NC0429]
MAPTIHVIRHAHAWHQAKPDTSIPDPELTELGIQQCYALAADIAKVGKIALIFSSPMKRAIQTALAAFPAYTQSRSKIVLLPALQEIGTNESDIGSSCADLVRQFGSANLDYSFVEAAWTNKGPGTPYDPQFATAQARAMRIFIRAVAQRYRATDAHIVVISHALFIGHLTRGDYMAYDNAEWRSFRFEQIVGGNGDASLYELPCSVTRTLAAHNREARRRSFVITTTSTQLVSVKREEKPNTCSLGDVHEVYCPMYGVEIPVASRTRLSLSLAPGSSLLGVQGGATGAEVPVDFMPLPDK